MHLYSSNRRISFHARQNCLRQRSVANYSAECNLLRSGFPSAGALLRSPPPLLPSGRRRWVGGGEAGLSRESSQFGRCCSPSEPINRAVSFQSRLRRRTHPSQPRRGHGGTDEGVAAHSFADRRCWGLRVADGVLPGAEIICVRRLHDLTEQSLSSLFIRRTQCIQTGMHSQCKWNQSIKKLKSYL